MYTNRSKGWRRDVPLKYCNGHASRKMRSVNIDLITGCWNWIKARQPNGYGCGHPIAHRMVWEWAYGPVPEGKELDHICRNRSCVNPDHLRIVTRMENAQCGLAAKLTPAEVIYIRELHLQGLSERKIAKTISKTREMVRHVVIGHTWRNVLNAG